MKLSYIPLTGLLTTSAMATNLYVSSYGGTITSLKLTENSHGGFSLTQVAVNDGSAPNPSWLTLDEDNHVVYCLDEGLDVLNGSIASYKTSESGKLTQIDRHEVINGPVSSTVYNNGKALAAAHYTGSAVTTWEILPSGGLKPLQNFTFVLTAPGTIPSRQDAPHPHEVVLDPTDTFIVVPDLGADLLRIFLIDHSTSNLIESTPVQVSLGAGPRHGAFLATGKDTFFFLVDELDNQVRSFKVTYGEDLITFDEVFESSTFGNAPPPVGAAASEAHVIHNGKVLVTASRNATLFDLPNFDPRNKTDIPSDTLQSWSIDEATGSLSFQQLAPAGGSFPRQFSVNKEGTLAAVGLQLDSRVVVLKVKPDGTFGDFVAEIDIAGQITCVIWDE